ncbi:uncharacterized protein LOC125208141 [Salvia hispanica]|uniref:uncharacterized protein LOC125208141 n=1 Tax=Salvia hispanica TaxID=49212 RepID=UPI0020098702|nr:uncharacterized protein LOC125208141 [Salvia hispanica]
MFDHWMHEHPLTLVETQRGDQCYGCEQPFSSGEQAYGCSKRCWDSKLFRDSKLFHEECVSMARKIQHPLHPQHILIQKRHQFWWERERHSLKCEWCERCIWGICYRCTSSGCKFQMHLRCAQGGDVVDATKDDDDEQRRAVIHHPSHPKHELKLLRRWCSFKCNACGTTRKGSSYTCINEACQYWIHERCASLPLTIERKDHHHSLSLSFHVPLEYIKFDYKCDVCSKFLFPQYWVYHCQLCRYIVHIQCAFNKPPRTIKNDADAPNRKDTIHLPTDEMVEVLITPFVMKQRGGRTLIPPIIPRVDDLVNAKYKFRHHRHKLTLVSSSPHDHQIEEDEEEDEENYGKRSELICDGCLTPISSSSRKYYYLSCGECKYNLHMACFHLPPRISSLPIHEDDHRLLLQSSNKLKPWKYQNCSVCEYDMNGLFYACVRCDFKVDVKCACMPDTIHHTAHPKHLLKCSSNSCDFIVHLRCVLLPASVTSSRWDKHHQLPLTYNATLNRPGDFYCDQCETQMNPKRWMYHCRHCDISFHPDCFKTTSGKWRNIKMGQEYENDEAHPHTLTFQLLTTKRRCDICDEDRHEQEGFHCASCNFFVCLKNCGKEMIRKGDMKAVRLREI